MCDLKRYRSADGDSYVGVLQDVPGLTYDHFNVRWQAPLARGVYVLGANVVMSSDRADSP